MTMADLVRADSTQACPSDPGVGTPHSLLVGAGQPLAVLTPQGLLFLSWASTQSLVHTRYFESLPLPRAAVSKLFCTRRLYKGLVPRLLPIPESESRMSGVGLSISTV